MSQHLRCGCQSCAHFTDEGGNTEGLMNSPKIIEKSDKVPAHAASSAWKLLQDTEGVKKSPRRAGYFQCSQTAGFNCSGQKGGIFACVSLPGCSGNGQHASSFPQIRKGVYPKPGLQAGSA